MCLKCREKSLVNIEFNPTEMIGIFHCYNCNEIDIINLKGSEPPIDKEDFTQQSRKLELKDPKKKKIN